MRGTEPIALPCHLSLHPPPRRDKETHRHPLPLSLAISVQNTAIPKEALLHAATEVLSHCP